MAVRFCIENDELWIENDEFWIENDEFCIENDELWIENDEFCIQGHILQRGDQVSTKLFLVFGNPCMLFGQYKPELDWPIHAGA